jgi:CHAD domain-containing protein
MRSPRSALQQLAAEIEHRRSALLTHYRDEDLHQLRITIRRLRGLLRQQDNPEALQLRRDWGKLADQTNPARDWDTLIMYLEHNLAAEFFAQNRAVLATRQAQAQQQVLDILRSPRWSTISSGWHDYLRQIGAEGEPTLPGQDIIAAARTRAFEAWQSAVNTNRESDWHRLRIAIKDLRYSLDTLAPVSPQTQATLGLCKELQTLLGDWHDTVVHRQLLEQLASGETVSVDKMTPPILAAVLADLQTRGSVCLQAVRKLLENGGLA